MQVLRAVHLAQHHVSDFGQTLNAYGVESGPYVVLPLFGPSTARDGVGFAVDSILLDPLGYLLPFEYNLGISVGQAVVAREAFDEASVGDGPYRLVQIRGTGAEIRSD